MSVDYHVPILGKFGVVRKEFNLGKFGARGKRSKGNFLGPGVLLTRSKRKKGKRISREV